MRPRASLFAIGGVLALAMVLLGWWAWYRPTATPQHRANNGALSAAPTATPQHRADLAALAAAQERWEQRPFTHYRLVLERRITDVYLFNDETCTQEIDVAAEQVVRVRHSTCPEPPATQDSSPSTYFFGCRVPPGQRSDGSPSRCPPPPMTVSELFQTIATYLHTPYCGANGCECDGRIVYRVEYDAQLGYPARMEPTMVRPPRPDGPCTAMGTVGLEPALTVRELVPEPGP